MSQGNADLHSLIKKYYPEPFQLIADKVVTPVGKGPFFFFFQRKVKSAHNY